MPPLYAIGDIHGRDHLLEKLYDRITADPHRPDTSERPRIIHLGDYIDGGPHSDRVINRVMRGLSGFETISLMGNHEALLLACLETDDRDVWWTWRSNGGDATLDALGLSTRFGGNDPALLEEALGKPRIAWLRSLKLHYTAGRYLFVHAGIVPGVPLARQKKKDMLWIRSRFLESDADHGHIIVHGHTQTNAPEVRPNRIGIDTGAARPETLTALAICDDQPPRFLQVSE